MDNWKNIEIMKISKFYIVFVLVALSLFQHGLAGNIVDTNDYSYWRELATTSAMFGAMKTDALNNTDGSVRDVMGSNALAYILDPENKCKYVNAIKKEFETEVTNIHIGSGAGTSSVPSHKLFHALLALDVIRDDITSEERANYENILSAKIFKLVTKQWRPHGYAMRMLWYKYLGDTVLFDSTKNIYDYQLEVANFLSDGVGTSQNGYCIERFNTKERAAKNQVFDMLEYMGYNEYYTWPELRKSYEWIYAWANSPFGSSIFYGDNRGSQQAWDVDGNEILSPTTVRAARFSLDAYKSAMWCLKEGAQLSDPTLKGYLLSYIIMAGSAEKNNPIEFDINDAELAPSKILTNYAILIGKNQSRNALYASIMSLNGVEDYHTHCEANAIALGGYGEYILRNAGYNGPDRDVSADGITTNYNFLARNAESGNTLMIGGNNHKVRHGNGMVEGFTGKDVEYVRALNNRAIDGEHFRDLVFIQAADSVNGYYIVLDHVTTDDSGKNINIVWHPNTAKVETIKENEEYYSEIKVDKGAAGPFLYSWDKGQRVTLNTFMGTTPSSVEKREMVNQWRGKGDDVHHYRAEYLYTTYPTNNNRADIITVLFPGDQNHSVGEITRLELDSYSGCQILQEQITDIALASNGLVEGNNGAASFQAENVIYRKDSEQLISYFIKGKSFQEGEYGFVSDSTVALYVKHLSGQIVSPGSKVKFHHPGITGIKINGKTLRNVDSGSIWVSVNVPKGTHSLELLITNTTHFISPRHNITLDEAHLGSLEIDTMLLNSYEAIPSNINRYYTVVRGTFLTDNVDFDNEKIVNAALKNEMPIMAGPMLGDIKDNGVSIWFRTSNKRPITIKVIAQNDSKENVHTLNPNAAGKDQRVIISDLLPSTNYKYEVYTKEEKITEGTFKTSPKNNENSDVRLAFGSCFHKIGLHNPNLINTIVKREPNAMLLLGDIAVDDRENSFAMHRSDYLLRDVSPAWKNLAANVPLYTNWDDHDYLNNDLSGIPVGFSDEDIKELRKIWEQNWNNPRNKAEGIYFNTRIGQIEIIMLDTRSCRTNNKRGEYGSYLGVEQQEWLKSVLESSTATFKVISSGTMWSDYVTKAKDSWGSWDTLAREEIFNLIETQNIPGVLLISGDRHGARAFTIPGNTNSEFVYYEFEAATLGGVEGPPAMAKDSTNQLFGYFGKGLKAFGEFTFNMEENEPQVTFRLIDELGNIMEEHKLTYDMLTPQK